MSDEIREQRLAKLARLRELGLDPYAIEKFARTDTAEGLLARYEELAPGGQTVSFAGRLLGLRHMGKASFAHVSDGDGKIQIYVRKDELTAEQWEAFGLLDIGDHLGVTGFLFQTKTEEKSIHVRSLTPLSKSLHQIPIGKEKDGESWYGLTDKELRFRHRHLDLLANPEARKVLLDRARVIQSVREYFWGEGFVEVETPMLQLVAGGAAARPFNTRFNHYKLDVKLRISLELYLKRVLCGDVPKVFELGRVFRNEGVSNRHNPEFTMIEWYEAFVNLEDTQERVEGCFRYVAEKVFGTTLVQIEDVTLDFGKPWQRVDMMEEISKATGVPVSAFSSLESAKAALTAVDIGAMSKAAGGWVDLSTEKMLGGLIEKLLEVFVEPHLIQPTFVVGYPVETSPLAKKDPSRHGYTRRSEGYVMGREVCNLFSEINDPIDQHERFVQQMSARAAGDDEAHPMDDEFVYALECGMPPAGGCGIGMDRMAMLLTGTDQVRDVLLFPMMKPRGHGKADED